MSLIVGIAEYPALRISFPSPYGSSLEAAADLALRALADAQLTLRDVDGLIVAGVHEAHAFVPATVAEYLGISVDYAETVDLGGATPAGMIWRAAAAVRAGLVGVVLCLVPGIPLPSEEVSAWRYGASSYRPGSPQAEFDIPYGHLGQNALYAQVAQRYAFEHGYDPRVMARLAAQQRENGAANPDALFFGKPVTAEEVLFSRMIATPIRMLEIVAPAQGGAAVVVVAPTPARACPHRPVRVAGHGERLSHKSPQCAGNMLRPPLEHAARRAYAMAGVAPDQIDLVQLYDCYTINTLISLEAAGFCDWGEGMAFLRDQDIRFHGSFPLNTNGGQLGMGQTGFAGGMTHVVEVVRQIRGQCGLRQVPRHDRAFVSGNGGVMSEQVALVLEGC